MGNDGGSIPKRRELVKEAAKNPTAAQLKETILEKQGYLWTTDPITNRPLCAPIVSDCNGRLFNKDAVLEFLLPSDDPETLTRKEEAEKLLSGAIRTLRDVVEVQFESDSGKVSNGAESRWICPITQKVLGPATRAIYLVPCGHAFSEVAMKEVADETKCLQCDEEFAPNDVIPILPVVETDIARLLLRISDLKERGLTHSLKKAAGSKKKKQKSDKKGVSAEDEKVPELIVQRGGAGASASVKPTANGGSGIKNSSTASLTAKVLEENEARTKKRKNENLASLFSSDDRSKQVKKNDFFTRGFTLSTNG